jgi:hypothetical protein
MWITQEPNKVALWNKRHFEEKNGECAACLKYSVIIFVEKKYKMQHLEGSGTLVLYIGSMVFLKVKEVEVKFLNLPLSSCLDLQSKFTTPQHKANSARRHYSKHSPSRWSRL